MQIKSFFTSCFLSAQKQTLDYKKLSLEQLTEQAERLSQSTNADERQLAIDANVELGMRLVKLAKQPRLPEQTQRKHVIEATAKFSKVVELTIGLGMRSPNYVQLLLDHMPPYLHFAKINHVFIAKADLESWARGKLPMNNREMWRAVLNDQRLNEAWDEVVQRGAANVHIPGLLSNGAMVLNEIRQRNSALLPSIESTAQTILNAARNLYGITDSEGTENPGGYAKYLSVKNGLDHALNQKTAIAEGGLHTTVHEAIRQMWWYCARHPTTSTQQNLVTSFMNKLHEINQEQCCNTGCAQRILQTVEGIDETFVLVSEQGLMQEAQALVIRLGEHIDQLNEQAFEANPDTRNLRDEPPLQGFLLTHTIQHMCKSLIHSLVVQQRHPYTTAMLVIDRVLEQVEQNELMLMSRDLADLNGYYTDHHEQSVLRRAVRRNDIGLLERALVAHPINVNDRNADGRTVLHEACHLGHQRIVEVLLKAAEIDVNLQTNEGDTALHIASSRGLGAVVDRLLEDQRTRVNIKNNIRQTPFVKALIGGHTNIAKKLLQAPGLSPSDGIDMRRALSELEALEAALRGANNF